MALACCALTWSGPVFDGLRGLITRLREPLQRLGYLGLSGDDIGLGFEHGGLIGGISGYGGVVLLLGDDVFLDERRVAFDVEVGLDGVGLGGDDAGLGGLLLLARLVDGGG